MNKTKTTAEGKGDKVRADNLPVVSTETFLKFVKDYPDYSKSWYYADLKRIVRKNSTVAFMINRAERESATIDEAHAFRSGAHAVYELLSRQSKEDNQHTASVALEEATPKRTGLATRLASLMRRVF